jgi:chemotaxis protein methyltransferase CheR
MPLPTLNTPPLEPPALRPDEFDSIRAMAHRVFGLDLRPGKEALVSARLSKRIRELGLSGIGKYLEAVQADRTGAELALLIDALTTNFTSFLREPQHFEFLASTVLPALAARPSFHIWSAGCATGEEPYSILFHTADTRAGQPVPAMRLTATDISTRALESASAGIYPEQRLREMPASWPKRYFLRGAGASQGYIRVRPEWRKHITFLRLNLMEDFSHLPLCSVIFCRNVMIYFDKPTQENLVRRFAERLEPGGWLFIGHSEGLLGTRHGLEPVQPAIYRKPAGARRPETRQPNSPAWRRP